ncbi:MAG: UvrD-helicase domain-containing protein, partial [Rhodothermales bacterium]
MRQFELSLREPSPLNRDSDEILQGLNPSQQEAVEATDGPVLIVAGPGSGKTRTLTHRIAYLIATGRARPYDVLALTFTNKAAREMRERITAIVGAEQVGGMWMGTFHSMFARLLRVEGSHLGYTSDFSIYDTDDSERIIRQLMDRFSIDSKQFTPRSLQNMISSAKNRLVPPADYARVAIGPFQEKAALIFAPYEEMLRRSNALDFD